MGSEMCIRDRYQYVQCHLCNPNTTAKRGFFTGMLGLGSHYRQAHVRDDGWPCSNEDIYCICRREDVDPEIVRCPWKVSSAVAKDYGISGTISNGTRTSSINQRESVGRTWGAEMRQMSTRASAEGDVTTDFTTPSSSTTLGKRPASTLEESSAPRSSLGVAEAWREVDPAGNYLEAIGNRRIFRDFRKDNPPSGLLWKSHQPVSREEFFPAVPSWTRLCGCWSVQ